MDKEIFKQIVKENKVKNNIFKDGLLAFVSGGILGIISQALIDLYHLAFNFELSLAYSLSSVTLVFLASVLTIFGLYNNLGQLFGAGLFVPITGFSNSMVSESIEGKSEGLIYGIGFRTFSLAGSVIVYGLLTSSICCIIYYFFLLGGVVA